MVAKILVTILLMSQFSAKAGENWTGCEKSTDCVVDEDPCMLPIGINRKYLKQNQLKNQEARPKIHCSEYRGPRFENFKAVCKSKTCKVEQIKK